MKKETKKEKTGTWVVKDLQKLPFNAVKVLNVFIEKNKKVLDSVDLQKELEKDGLTGRKFGATMAIFSKYSKEEPLLRCVLRMGRGNSRWVISEKYLPMVKEYISQVAQYLKK